MKNDSKKKEVDLATHCIGLDRKKPYQRHGRYFYRPYRNYYAAGKDDAEIWTHLCKQEYAEKGISIGECGCMFRLTRKGLDWLGKELNIHIYDEMD